MQEPFVVHCWIPGTGNALDRRVLVPAYGAGNIQFLTGTQIEQATRLPTAEVSRAMRSMAASGTVPFGFFERIYPEAIYLSVLRDPVARFLECLQVQETGYTEQDPAALVEAALADAPFMRIEANLQTRIVSGRAIREPDPVQQAHFEAARICLTRRNYLVGHHAQLDRYLMRLDGLLPSMRPSWPRESPALRPSQAPRFATADLPPRLVQRIRQANYWDLRLHEMVELDRAGARAAA